MISLCFATVWNCFFVAYLTFLFCRYYAVLFCFWRFTVQSCSWFCEYFVNFVISLSRKTGFSGMFLRKIAGFFAAQYSEIAPQKMTVIFLLWQRRRPQFQKQIQDMINIFRWLNPLYTCAECWNIKFNLDFSVCILYTDNGFRSSSHEPRMRPLIRFFTLW